MREIIHHAWHDSVPEKDAPKIIEKLISDIGAKITDPEIKRVYIKTIQEIVNCESRQNKNKRTTNMAEVANVFVKLPYNEKTEFIKTLLEAGYHSLKNSGEAEDFIILIAHRALQLHKWGD